jgi:hypothetical protein
LANTHDDGAAVAALGDATAVSVLISMNHLCSQPVAAYQLAVQAGILDWFGSLETVNYDHVKLANILLARQRQAFIAAMPRVLVRPCWMTDAVRTSSIQMLDYVCDDLDQHIKVAIVTSLVATYSVHLNPGGVMLRLLAKCLACQTGLAGQAFLASSGPAVLAGWINYALEKYYDKEIVLEPLLGLLAAAKPDTELNQALLRDHKLVAAITELDTMLEKNQRASYALHTKLCGLRSTLQTWKNNQSNQPNQPQPDQAHIKRHKPCE